MKITQYIPFLTTSYQENEGFGHYEYQTSEYYTRYFAKMIDKTMYWYTVTTLNGASPTTYQLNNSNYTYHWMAIG